MFNFGETISKDRAKQFSPTVLAFIGDAVYSLYVRNSFCFEKDYKLNDLQKMTAERVSAHGQAKFLSSIIDKLNEEEKDVFMRGRNAKKATKSKNASVVEYNISTGFEALVGYLYITGEIERLNEILGQV